MSLLLTSQASRIRENICPQGAAGRADSSSVSCKALKHNMIDTLSLVMLCVSLVPPVTGCAEFTADRQRCSSVRLIRPFVAFCTLVSYGFAGLFLFFFLHPDPHPLDSLKASSFCVDTISYIVRDFIAC